MEYSTPDKDTPTQVPLLLYLLEQLEEGITDDLTNGFDMIGRIRGRSARTGATRPLTRTTLRISLQATVLWTWLTRMLTLTQRLIMSLALRAWPKTEINRNMCPSLQGQEPESNTKPSSATTCLRERFVVMLGTWAPGMTCMAVYVRSCNGGSLLRSWAGSPLVVFGVELLLQNGQNSQCSKAWFIRPCFLASNALSCRKVIMRSWIRSCSSLLANSRAEKLAPKVLMTMVLFITRLFLTSMCIGMFASRRARMSCWSDDSVGVNSWLAVLICILFGLRVCLLTLQHDGSIHVKANPWAQQFANDILVQLSQFEDGATLVSFLENQPLRVFTDFRHEFWRLDVSPIRQKHFTSAIPPPEYVPQPDASADEAEGYIQEDEPVFRCDCLCEDGRPCTAVFKTRQQLSVHVRSTKGGTHAEVPRYRKLAITNQCPFVASFSVVNVQPTAHQTIPRQASVHGQWQCYCV